MFLPPAAAWRVDSAHLQRRVLAVLGLPGALLGVFFGWSQGWSPHSLWLLLLDACALAIAAAVQRPVQGQLRWDGERWHWAAEEELAVTRLLCVMDLQRFLLLRIDCAGGQGLWLWLHSPSMDSRWLALRRAVVASQRHLQPSQSTSLPE